MRKPNRNKQRIGALIFTALLAVTLGGGSAAAASPPSREGSITIRKFRAESFENLKEGTGSQTDGARVPIDAQQLAGICFKLEKPRDSAFEPITKATDRNGEIVFPGLQTGVYRVTELPPEGFAAQKESFLVQIPMGENYDVHVYPKNMGKGETPNTQPEIPPRPQDGKGKPGPVTGDGTELLGLVLLAAGALAGLAWLFWPKRKGTRG